MVKTKRNITSSNQKDIGQTKNRPSVFERLGIKAGSSSGVHKDFCHHWAQNGSCPYGKGCKYSATHTLISPSKQRAAKNQTPNSSKKNCNSKKDDHKRDTNHGGIDEDWSHWDPNELEDADADDLERKRQELQRELELQMKLEQHKVRKKSRKTRKETSPSTSDSTSTSSDSSTSSTSSSDDSSSSSSTSTEAKSKKIQKKSKLKRTASSSSSGEISTSHKKKFKQSSKSHIHQPIEKSSKRNKLQITKSVSPAHVQLKKKSETPPPIKSRVFVKQSNSDNKSSALQPQSPRSLSRSSDRKDKYYYHHTPPDSPNKISEVDKSGDKERDKDLTKEKEPPRDRDKQKGQREKERDTDTSRPKQRNDKKEQPRDRDRPSNSTDAKLQRGGNDKLSKDPKRTSKEKKRSPNRSSKSSTSKNSASEKRDAEKPNRIDDYRGRSRSRERRASGGTYGDKSRKDKQDSRDRFRDREKRREEREAAREKEREEALARCQERQRERERLKQLELEKKENERREKNRNRRSGGSDRRLDKPTSAGRRHSSMDRERNDSRKSQMSDIGRKTRNPPSHDHRIDRLDLHEHSGYEVERSYNDRGHNDRGNISDYGTRRRRDERRLDEKNYETVAYDNRREDDRRYLAIDNHYTDSLRETMDEREYVDDRRGSGRRDMWDESDRLPANYSSRGRDIRQNAPIQGHGNEWIEKDYPENEWSNDSRGSRRPIEWENRDDEWRRYNWSATDDNKRRWQANQNQNTNDWKDRDFNARSKNHDNSHHIESSGTEEVDARRKTDSGQTAKPETITSEVQSSKSAEAVGGQSGTENKQGNQSAGKRGADEQYKSSEPKKSRMESVSLAAAAIDDDLSEISDDLDDILDRVEETAEIVDELDSADAQETQKELSGQQDGQQTTSSSANCVREKSATAPDQSPPKNVVVKEESLEDNNIDDFEEISEGELDEEARIKGVGDALGVDWASLVAESKSEVKPSPAKLRWEAHNILTNLGISVGLAGEKLVKDILKEHVEFGLFDKSRENCQADVTSYFNTNEIKQEIKDLIEDCNHEYKADYEDVCASHPIAAVQVSKRQNHQIRRNLFSSVGPYRRALSARRDLTVRRYLCNLPLNDTYVETPKRYNPELFEITTQLLFEKYII